MSVLLMGWLEMTIMISYIVIWSGKLSEENIYLKDSAWQNCLKEMYLLRKHTSVHN